MNKLNLIWVCILVISLFGGFFLIKVAYANHLGLPDYAFTKPQIKEAYEYAKTNSEMLEGLPCNCGCMSDASALGGRLHSRGLIDCFMEGDVNNGGKWDAHASECGLCYEDSLQAKKLYQEGKTKEQVAEFLKEKYKGQEWSNDTVY